MKNLFYLLTLFGVQSCFAQYYSYNNQFSDATPRFKIAVAGGLQKSETDLSSDYAQTGWINYSKTIHGTTGIQLVYEPSYYWRLEFGYEKGKLSDADSLVNPQKAALRYNRNLSFQTETQLVFLNATFSPNEWLKIWKNNAIDWQIGMGVGCLKFNPKAYFENEWHSLHSYSTEGQGFLYDNGKAPYSLTQPVVIGTTSLQVDLHPKWQCQLSFNYYFLFTDYLDDVSEYYIQDDLFHRYFDSKKAAIASQLSNRRRDGVRVLSTEKRGNPEHKDAFAGIRLSILYVVNRKRF